MPNTTVTVIESDATVEITVDGTTTVVNQPSYSVEIVDSSLQGLQGPPGGGLAAVVEDTTPQLGGDLDLNSHQILGTVETTQFILDGGLL